jgi:enoyl-CoA hydratase/carnithine racemase
LEFLARESANALSLDGARELGKIQREYKSWRKPVVVTSVHPSVFCSGGNLTDHKKSKTKAAGLKSNREI